MSNSLELIERYFEDDLNAEETVQFQQRLESDPEFAKAFQLEKDLMEGIKGLGNLNLEEVLQEIYEEEIEAKNQAAPKLEEVESETEKAPAKVRSLSRRWWLMAAASIVGLLVVMWVINRPSPEKLYAEYFNPDFSFGEKSGNREDLIVQMEAALKGEEYSKAIPILDALLKENPENMNLLLNKGIALTKVGQFKEAISIFNTLKNNPVYYTEAEWHEALTYLKQNKIPECRQGLQRILDKSEVLKARQLLNDLEGFK